MTTAVKVVAVIATYRRELELRRLLERLGEQSVSLCGVVVVDNASEAGLQMQISHFPFPISIGKVVYLAMAENRGCGAGLKAGEEDALKKFPDLTHVWILDDDVVPSTDCLEKLLRGMELAKADLICPLLSDEQGSLWGFPEPRGTAVLGFKFKVLGWLLPSCGQPATSYLQPYPERLIRKCRTPQDVGKKLGPGPHPMWWCTGACVLVSRRALDEVGLHRDDYWMLGEDHEFSMRVGERFVSVFVTDAEVPHLPPPVTDLAVSEQAHYRKFLALLQNLTYNALRLPISSGPMWRYLPGNYKRFFKTFGLNRRTLGHAGLAFFYGAICGEAAGGRRAMKMREGLFRK